MNSTTSCGSRAISTGAVHHDGPIGGNLANSVLELRQRNVDRSGERLAFLIYLTGVVYIDDVVLSRVLLELFNV